MTADRFALLCFQSREHAVEKRHSPSPVEDFLASRRSQAQAETSFRALELQRNDRDATTTLPGDPLVVLLAAKFFNDTSRNDWNRPGGRRPIVFLENPREEGLVTWASRRHVRGREGIRIADTSTSRKGSPMPHAPLPKTCPRRPRGRHSSGWSRSGPAGCARSRPEYSVGKATHAGGALSADRLGHHAVKRAQARSIRFHRRVLKPASRLTRTPDFEGTTARFTGTFNPPARNVMPAAMARAAPTGVMLGPIPNSAPFIVRIPTSQLTLGSTTPCSSPPTSTTHSVTAVGPFSVL